MGFIRKASRHPVVFEGIEGGAKGCLSHVEPKHIAIQKEMSRVQTPKTAAHELAHSIVHDIEPSRERTPDRDTQEVQAESVAYVVSS